MECSRVRELINDYIEDKCSIRDRERIKEHMEKCASCRAGLEAHGLLENIFDEKDADDSLRYRIMDEVRKVSKNQDRRLAYMNRKKLIAAVMGVCIIGGSFIPVNGVTLAESIINWSKSISIKDDNNEIKASDDYGFTEKEKREFEEELKENAKSFEEPNATFDEVKDAMGDYFVQPLNIPEKYDFKVGDVELVGEDDLSSMMAYRFIYENDLHEKIDIDYTVVKAKGEHVFYDTPRKRELTGEDMKFIEIEVSGIKGVVGKSEGFATVILSDDVYLSSKVGVQVKIDLKNNMSLTDEESVVLLKSLTQSIYEQYSIMEEALPDGEKVKTVEKISEEKRPDQEEKIKELIENITKFENLDLMKEEMRKAMGEYFIEPSNIPNRYSPRAGEMELLGQDENQVINNYRLFYESEAKGAICVDYIVIDAKDGHKLKDIPTSFKYDAKKEARFMELEVNGVPSTICNEKNDKTLLFSRKVFMNDQIAIYLRFKMSNDKEVSDAVSVKELVKMGDSILKGYDTLK